MDVDVHRERFQLVEREQHDAVSHFVRDAGEARYGFERLFVWRGAQGAEVDFALGDHHRGLVDVFRLVADSQLAQRELPPGGDRRRRREGVSRAAARRLDALPERGGYVLDVLRYALYVVVGAADEADQALPRVLAQDSQTGILGDDSRERGVGGQALADVGEVVSQAEIGFQLRADGARRIRLGRERHFAAVLFHANQIAEYDALENRRADVFAVRARARRLTPSEGLSAVESRL